MHARAQRLRPKQLPANRAERAQVGPLISKIIQVTMEHIKNIVQIGAASGSVRSGHIGGIGCVSRNTRRKAAKASGARPRAVVKFIDLFAGLGGFHLALANLGHQCVFASELDPDLAVLYEKNFGLKPYGDIRTCELKDIPKHDVLCAGFPCQPFSKAGEQRGSKCPQWGDLIDYVIDILHSHKPEYFIIENVPNLVRHNRGRTWRKIKERLQEPGYDIDDRSSRRTCSAFLKSESEPLSSGSGGL